MQRQGSDRPGAETHPRGGVVELSRRGAGLPITLKQQSCLRCLVPSAGGEEAGVSCGSVWSLHDNPGGSLSPSG